MPLVSVRRLATMFEMDCRRVSETVRRLGVPTVYTKRGGPRLVGIRAFADAVIAEEVAKHVAADGGESLAQAELRKARADADMAEARAAEMANRLIPRAAADAVFRDLLTVTGAHLDALPRLAGRIAAEADPAVVRDLVFAEARRVRAAIADDVGRAADDQADD